MKLTVVGNSGDFIDAATNKGPEWEHLVLLRDPDCVALAVDALKSPPTSRLPGRRYVDAGMIYRLARALRASDVILAQSEQSGYLAALATAASFGRQNLCIIFHGHGWQSRRNRAFTAIAKRLSSVQLLCLSRALRDLVIREYGFDPSRVHTTGFGVDAKYFSPTVLLGPGCVVSAGTASRDYRTLAAASAGLNAQVRVAADSTWYREALNVSDAEIPANMEVFSAGDYAGLRTLYRRALFVVVPLLDVRYACGYAVIAEAMAMGKAVIATRTGGPSDLIADGVSGMYVPPSDVTALRQAMQDLLAHPDKAIAMGRAGRDLVERQFNLDAYVARLRNAMRLER